MRQALIACVSVAAASLCGGAARAQQPAAEPSRPYVMPADAPAYIRRAVESPERSDEMRARDFNRKPAEVLMLAGLKEGNRVVEIAGFGQYFTMLLCAAVGPKGRVDVYDLPYTERFAGEASRAFDAKHDNETYMQVSYNDAKLPQNVDAVYMILYYHDLKPQGVDTAALNRKILAALKPGGIYLVIDHKAEDGSGWRDAGTIHRIGVETIKQEVLAAGFELARESDLLANPKDDRSKRVFAPGTRGTTDQAVFVFRKPR